MRDAAHDWAASGILRAELAPLLRAIQQHRVFDDPKNAVDIVLRSPPAGVAAAAEQLLAGEPSAEQLRAFIEEHFAPAGSDLLPYQPADWVPHSPGFLANLKAPTGAASGPPVASAVAPAEGALGGAAEGGGAGDGGEGAWFYPGGDEEEGFASSEELLAFGLQVHGLWKLLSRKATPPPGAGPLPSTLLPLPHPTVVPGDRFRETYYWDSLWVLHGLLASGMGATAAGLVRNLMHMLGAVGHVPNGGRGYYLNRSQPPLLSAMVRLVAEATGDASLVRDALPLLMREHAYWTSGRKALRVRGADGRVHNLSRYWADWFEPRPESHAKDTATASKAAQAAATAREAPGGPAAPTPSAAAAAAAAAAAGEAAAEEGGGGEEPGMVPGGGFLDALVARRVWHELATAAESGWDFSSRWFEDGATMATIRTSQIIPADLNAFLFQMERNVQWAAAAAGDDDAAGRFDALAAARRDAMAAVLWDDAVGCWRDGVLVQPAPPSGENAVGGGPAEGGAAGGSGGRPECGVCGVRLSSGVYASNYVPLWAGLAEGDEELGARVVASLEASGLVQPGGISTSLYATGQQWDAPNGWPPLQHMLVEGARASGGPAGRRLARRVARAWVRSNYAAWKATGHMHEKYDVRSAGGGVGGGGEYAPQVGFGWSNGVLLRFLSDYF